MTRASQFWQDVLSLLNLAWPVMISRLGILTLTMVDIAMVGHYSSEHLAHIGLAVVPHNIFILIMLGLIMGTSVLVSNAYGAGQLHKAARIWWQALPWGFGIGVLGLIICAFGEPLLLLTGQSPEMAEKAGALSFIAGLSLPLAALHMTTGFFLEGTRNPRPGMVIMIFANLVNILANYALVFGHFGAPEMGAAGSLWATFIVRTAQVLAMFAYIWFFLDRAKFGLEKRPRFNWSEGRELRRIGYATGLSMGIENAAFNALALFAGLLGALVVGAHVITITVFALFFMIGLGLAVATSVSVGNANGAGDMAGVARWMRIGLALQVMIMLVFGAGMYVFARPMAQIFSGDEAVLMLAAPLIAYSGVALSLDTGQALLAMSLRARGDTWFPTYAHLIAYAGIMIPVAYIAIFWFDRGPFGLVDSIVIGTFFPFAVLLARYLYLDRKQLSASLQTGQ